MSSKPADTTGLPGANTNGPAEVSDPQSLEKRFRELVSAWKADSLVLSSVTAMARLPSYRQIIALGRAVVPRLLRELDQDPDHWFWALNELTGADPIPPESRGRLPEMAQAWVRWGREQGYRW
jgi:hypothetical protein